MACICRKLSTVVATEKYGFLFMAAELFFFLMMVAFCRIFCRNRRLMSKLRPISIFDSLQMARLGIATVNISGAGTASVFEKYHCQKVSMFMGWHSLHRIRYG